MPLTKNTYGILFGKRTRVLTVSGIAVTVLLWFDVMVSRKVFFTTACIGDVTMVMTMMTWAGPTVIQWVGMKIVFCIEAFRGYTFAGVSWNTSICRAAHQLSQKWRALITQIAASGLAYWEWLAVCLVCGRGHRHFVHVPGINWGNNEHEAGSDVAVSWRSTSSRSLLGRHGVGETLTARRDSDDLRCVWVSIELAARWRGAGEAPLCSDLTDNTVGSSHFAFQAYFI